MKKLSLLLFLSILFVTGCSKTTYNRLGYFFVESTNSGYNVSVSYNISSEVVIAKDLSLEDATILCNKFNVDLGKYYNTKN